MSDKNLNDLDFAIFFTLSYSDIFDFPLTASEIELRLPRVWDLDFLIGKKKTSQAKKIIKNSKKIKKSLNKLINGGLVFEKKNRWQSFYCLKGRKAIIKKRLAKSKFIPAKEASMAEFLEILRKIPFISAVFLTGSSAVNNGAENDDLDFLIITKNNRLWLSRLLLILISKLRGKQPSLDAENGSNIDRSNAWCLNMWLTEDSLKLKTGGGSIYQAYEVLQMRSLWERDDFSPAFYWANRNLGVYLDLPKGKKSTHLKAQEKQQIYFFLNYCAYFLQIVYRKIFFKNENFLLGLNFAYFNNSQRGERIFAELKAKMRDVIN